MDNKITVGSGLPQWLGYAGLALLVGFMFVPNSYYAMVTFPWIMVWQMGFLLLGISLLVMIRQFDRPFRHLGYGLDWAVGAVAIACLLSVAFASFKSVALWNLATVSGYVVVLYVVRNWMGGATQKFWTWLNLWRGLAIVGFGMSISSLLEWQLIDTTNRNYFPLGHHNFVSAYFCLVLPLVLSYALTQTGKTRILLLLLTGILPYNIYTCSSRGGFVGLLLWAIATIGFVIWRTKGKKRLIFSAIALGLLTLMIVVGLQHPRVKQIIQVNDSKNIPSVQFKVDGETQDRLFMWQAAANILKDRPLTGVGLGNMSRVYNLYRPIDVGTGAAHVQQLHSTPVQLFGELGLIGMAAIAFLFMQIFRLGWKIHTHTENPHIKRLLYGMGGSWFAYGMATLTDYQLENIPISLTLALSVACLIAVADETLPESIPTAMSESQRRLFSLNTVGGTFAALFVALPQTIAMNLFAQGQHSWQKGYTQKAFEQVAVANNLASWDPTYATRLGLWMLETSEYGNLSAQEKRQILTLASQYLQDAAVAAPNDAYLNNNVAVILSEIDPALAEPYLTKTVQLLPRDAGEVYLLLSQAYLQQGQRDKAIAALAIQGLISPEMMRVGLLETKAFAAIRVEAVTRCLALYETLLPTLSPTDPFYVVIQERMALMAWWHGLPIPHEAQRQTFSPMTQALVLGDRHPEKALAIINEQLKDKTENETRWLILRAWFDVNAPLNLQLKVYADSPMQTFYLSSALGSEEKLQDWLQQIPAQSTNKRNRLVASLVYRNQDFEDVAQILLPQNLQRFQLVQLLGLDDGGYPRTLPTVEALINQVRTEQLGLPHPTENHFQVTK